MAQRVGRGIALLFHDRDTRRVVSGEQHAPAALYPRKDPVPIVQEAGWAPGPVWTGEKSRPHRDSIPDRPARRELLYQLSYLAHLTSHPGTFVARPVDSAKDSQPGQQVHQPWFEAVPSQILGRIFLYLLPVLSTEKYIEGQYFLINPWDTVMLVFT